MQLKLLKPTMAIGYSLRMCAQNVDSTNPGRSNLVFRSKPIAEAEMSNRLIGQLALNLVAGLLIAVAPRYRYCSGATFTVAVAVAPLLLAESSGDSSAATFLAAF